MTTLPLPSVRCLVAVLVAATGSLLGCNSDLERPQPQGLDGQGPLLQLELVSQISGYDVEVANIGAIAVDDHRRIYVLDTDPNSRGLIVLGPDGQALTRFGRPGEGPGEFRSVRHTLAWLGDTVMAFDWRSRRLTGFDQTGAAVISQLWPEDVAAPARLYSGESVVHGATVTSAPAGGGAVVNYVRYSPDGSVAPLPQLTESIPGPLGMNCATPDGQWIHPLEIPFASPTGVRGFVPTGELVRADRASYKIEFVSPESGEVVRSIQRRVEARPLLTEDWERTPQGAWIRQYEREGGGRLVDPQDRTVECPLYGLLPEFAPPIRTITVTSDGRMLVEAANPGDEGGYSLTLYDAQGSIVGETEMPDRDGRVAPFARGNLLYLVVIDDLDVQSIMVYEFGTGE